VDISKGVLESILSKSRTALSMGAISKPGFFYNTAELIRGILKDKKKVYPLLKKKQNWEDRP
jgi:hypothetical protein